MVDCVDAVRDDAQRFWDVVVGEVRWQLLFVFLAQQMVARFRG